MSSDAEDVNKTHKILAPIFSDHNVTFHYIRHSLLHWSGMISYLRLSIIQAWMDHVLDEFIQILDDRSQIGIYLKFSPENMGGGCF